MSATNGVSLVWRRPRVAIAATLTAIVCAGGWLAPRALADPTLADPVATLKAALAASRAASSCPAFHDNAVVQHVAEVINKSSNDWLDNDTTHVPITDPLPGLKELGYGGSKGTMFGGASAKSQADAIKGALLEGFARIPDCSYTDMGASMMFNQGSGENIITVVLAGP